MGPGRSREPLATITIPAIREDGIVEGFPWTDYGPEIDRFWSAVRRARLSAEPFDWPAWLEEVRASGTDHLGPMLVASLTAQDLRRYLTALERSERFSDGTWRAALDSGAFEALVGNILVLDRHGQL